MNASDWIYGIIGGYLVIMGILGINLKVIWITFTFRVKVYDFEYLYGRTLGRILFIVFGMMILVLHFYIFNNLF